MIIANDRARLFAQLSGRQPIELCAESATQFFVKVVDAQITLGVDAGAVTHLVLHQAGRDLKEARRQP